MVFRGMLGETTKQPPSPGSVLLSLAGGTTVDHAEFRAIVRDRSPLEITGREGSRDPLLLEEELLLRCIRNDGHLDQHSLVPSVGTRGRMSRRRWQGVERECQTIA